MSGQERDYTNILIGPKSDHYLALSITHWQLTDSLTGFNKSASQFSSFQWELTAQAATISYTFELLLEVSVFIAFWSGLGSYFGKSTQLSGQLFLWKCFIYMFHLTWLSTLRVTIHNEGIFLENFGTWVFRASPNLKI